MKLIEGPLKRLGASTVHTNRGVVTYSLVQIGDQTLTNVVIDLKLDNFLGDGLRTQARTRLWMLNSGKAVMAVQVGNDTRYYGTLNPFFYVGAAFNVVLTAIVFTMNPVGGAVWAAVTAALFGRKWLSYRQIAAVGGVKV